MEPGAVIPDRCGRGNPQSRVCPRSRNMIENVVTSAGIGELVAHRILPTARRSVLAALSGAIAHEINQPLTAILSNAQAALHLLGQTSPDLAKVRDALQVIVSEEQRAEAVISRLRNPMVNSTTELMSTTPKFFAPFFSRMRVTGSPQIDLDVGPAADQLGL